MKELFLIFAGSGLGGVVRFLLGSYISSLSKFHFPMGTFVVNIVACLILGMVAGLALSKLWLSPHWRTSLVIGFCGGFSTFSTFSYESLQLFKQGQFASMLLYITASVLLCMLAVGGGLYMGSKLG
jgi:CrcB protein